MSDALLSLSVPYLIIAAIRFTVGVIFLGVAVSGQDDELAAWGRGHVSRCLLWPVDLVLVLREGWRL